MTAAWRSRAAATTSRTSSRHEHRPGTAHRPRAGHTYHIRLVVDDTIGTLYVDGVALNVRMYERPGESLGVFATDGTVEVRNASIARGLKRK